MEENHQKAVADYSCYSQENGVMGFECWSLEYEELKEIVHSGEIVREKLH